MTGFPSSSNINRISIMRSAINMVNYHKTSCLMLWTYITGMDAELTISMDIFTASSVSRVKLFRLTNVTHRVWTQQMVQLNASHFSDAKEFELIIQGETTQANTVIALDDIELSDSACAVNNQWRCANKQLIHVDQVCNFVKDCSDGSDETNCGTCDFENNCKFSMMFL